MEHFRTADMTASDVAQTWTLVMEEGDLKVYKKETVEDGILIEPHKAVYTTTVGTANNPLTISVRFSFRNNRHWIFMFVYVGHIRPRAVSVLL